MSTYRSANTRQSQTQGFSGMQKRQPLFAKPQLRQSRRAPSIASTSVYDPDESQPNIRLTLKQAITLITLRLGKLEVFMNDTKIGGMFKQDGESKNVDNEFLSSIISRIDSLEKTQHNLRIEMENVKNKPNFNEEPIIVDIIEKLSILDEVTTQIQNDFDSLKESSPEVVEPTEIEPVPEVDTFPAYDPNVIEPYQSEAEIQVEAPVQEIQEIQKTPRKKAGKKVSI